MTDYRQRLNRVYEAIHSDLSADLSIDALADIAALSRFHFHRVFTTMTGETVAEAVRRLRLHHAAFALVQSETSVAQIGAQVGYPDAAAFSRAFKRSYGVSPVAFRQRGHRIAALGSHEFQTGDLKMFDVEIKDCQPQRAVGIMHTGPFQKIGVEFNRLWGEVGARGLFPHVRGSAAVFFDDPSVVEEANLRSLAAILVDPDFDCPDGLEAVELQGGRCAVLRLKGPYTGLEAAYKWLYGSWLAQSGETPAHAPCWESYLNAPQDTAPEDLLTEIHLPLAE